MLRTKNINVNVQRPPTNIPLGRQGENLATCVIFDCTGLVQLYGDGTAELLHELKSGTVYPVAIQQDGASVSWIVTASDTATVGAGRAELRWYVGDTLAKSAKFRTSVSSALADSTTETPPEPQKSWVDKVLQAAQEIKDGAISDDKLAEAIAAYLEDHPIDAGLDEAELAAYLVENGYLTDAALADAIAQALAEAKASGEFDGTPGKDGADGAPGADGADGVGIQSVVQTTTSTEDGGTNIVTVTKTDGTTSTFKVKNGSKGSDGEPGVDGKNGADGQPGTDGVTPNIQIGTVDTLPAGSPATASLTGTPENPLLNLGIPKGADGTGESITAEQLAQIEQNTADITDLKESLLTVQSAVSAKMDSYTIKTHMDGVAMPHTQYYLGNQTAVDIVLPDTANVGQIITVCWYNGETPATLSITGTMLDFDYIPGANSRSEINALWDGLNWAILGNEMAVVSDA